MSLVRQYRSTEKYATGVGSAPFTNIRTNTGKGELASAAANLGNKLSNIVVGLAQKAQRADDIIASAETARIQKIAELHYQEKIDNDPDTNNYKNYLSEYNKEISEGTSGLKWGTKLAKQKSNVNLKTGMEIFAARANSGIVKQKTNEALIIATANFDEAMSSSDSMPGQESAEEALKFLGAIENLKDALEAKYSSDVAEPLLNDAIEKGEKKRTKNAIFSSIRTASETQDQDNYNITKELIDKSTLNPEEKYRLERTLDASISSVRQKNTDKTKAYIEEQSGQIGQAFSQNQPLTNVENLSPQVQEAHDKLTERQGNNTLDVGDDILYDFMQDKVNLGKYLSQTELTDAYADGLSTEQYLALKQSNEDNKKLTGVQKESFDIYKANVQSRLKAVKAIIPKVSLENVPRVQETIKGFEKKIYRDVKAMVSSGEEGIKIDNYIANAFDSNTESMWRGWWSRKWHKGAEDFTKEIQDLDNWDKRADVLMELLKSGEDMSNVNDLIEKWDRDTYITESSSWQ